jgi:hypothetical protein
MRIRITLMKIRIQLLSLTLWNQCWRSRMLSRILIVISDKQQQQKRRRKKYLLCYLSFEAPNFTKFKIIFLTDIENELAKSCSIFYPKNCHWALKIWFGDPRIRIRKKPTPDPWSRDLKGTGSRIQIRNNVSNNHSGSTSLPWIPNDWLRGYKED